MYQHWQASLIFRIVLFTSDVISHLIFQWKSVSFAYISLNLNCLQQLHSIKHRSKCIEMVAFIEETNVYAQIPIPCPTNWKSIKWNWLRMKITHNYIRWRRKRDSNKKEEERQRRREKEKGMCNDRNESQTKNKR